MSTTQRVLGAVGVVGVLFFLVGASGGSTITGEQARVLVEKQGALLLDVRTAEEFAEGHLDGATNLPVQQLESRLGAFPAKKDQNVVVYCRSGARSGRATQMLRKAGYVKVFDLGAMSNWK